MEIQSINLKYKILVDWELFKVFHFLLSHKYDKEFTVLTHCKREENEFTLYDYFIPNQVNRSAHTEFDDDDYVELLSEGMDLTIQTGHMHSHANIASVSPSGTDKNEILERSETGGFSTSIIMNKKISVYGHIADHTTGLYLTKVPVIIKVPITEDQIEQDIFSRVNECTDLDEVKELVNSVPKTIPYNLEADPLSEDIVADLENKIEERFNSPYQSNVSVVNRNGRWCHITKAWVYSPLPPLNNTKGKLAGINSNPKPNSNLIPEAEEDIVEAMKKDYAFMSDSRFSVKWSMTKSEVVKWGWIVKPKTNSKVKNNKPKVKSLPKSKIKAAKQKVKK